MGEIIRLVSKSERERIRLIREARAIYDSVFPPADLVSEQRDKGPQLNGAQWRQCSMQRGFLVIKIIVVPCSLSSPANCHEQTVTTSDLTDISMQSCLVGAPQLAEWMKQHPAERLMTWRCMIGNQDRGGA